jgi:hypothetical protein
MLCRLKCGPAAVLLKASRAFLAAAVEQLHAHVFPDGMGSVDARRVNRLNFNDPVTATASHSQDVPRIFGQAPLLDGNSGSGRTTAGI